MLMFVPNQTGDLKVEENDKKKHESTSQAVVTSCNTEVYEHFRMSRSSLFNHSKTAGEFV